MGLSLWRNLERSRSWKEEGAAQRRRATAGTRRKPTRSRPSLEVLEDRVVLSSNAEYVQGLYQEVLHRSASQAEVAHFANQLNQGASRDQVAQVFVNSPERHDRDVAGLYQEILLRSSSAQERAGWVSNLTGGMSLDDVGRQLLLSPEYQQAHPSDGDFVRGLYADLLRRRGDNQEVAGWQTNLAAGATRSDVVNGFLDSREREHIVVGNLAAELLHRSGPEAEKDGWSTSLEDLDRRLEELARLFVTSSEFETETEVVSTGTPGLPGSRSPGVLRLDDTVTLPLPAGPMTVRAFAELFSGYPIPSAGGPALVDQLLATQAASTPVTTPTSSLSVVPLYVTYTGPTPSNLPAKPILITAANVTGLTVTFGVSLVSATP